MSARLYAAAFAARCEHAAATGQPVSEQPGLVGLLPSARHPVVRLLVMDDRAQETVGTALPHARSGMFNVFAGATACRELLRRLPGWRPEATTALVRTELETVPDPVLPDTLTVKAVRRRPEDPADGVPLEDAVAAAMRAGPSIAGPPEAFAAMLRSMPGTTRLFAAVDEDGVVRATSGFTTSGTVTNVIFVDTDPDWRGRGIGRAMTAAALRAAYEGGARRACLDATDAGLSIYRRLGFEAVAPNTRFFRAA